MTARPLGPAESAELARALAPLTRRRFFALAGAAAAAGLLPTGCAEEPPAWQRAPEGVALRHLSARQYAVLAAAIARFVGGEGAGWIAEGRVAPAATADAWLGSQPALAGPLAQGLLLLEFGVYPLVAKLRPFTALAGAAQDAVLDDLAGSAFGLKRMLWRGLRTISFLTFYADPAVRPLIHHPGPFGAGAVSIADAMRWTPPPR
ncbi:MAG TPA: hypothetical protein VNE71_16380 [Myxococcota bacterium]|nr:hypothetical protein [Myxococcota bacterium]